MPRMSPRIALIAACALSACADRGPMPAAHTCLDLAAGDTLPLTPPTVVWGAGLTYAAHLRETGQSGDGPPPVFAKEWSPTTASVAVPSREALIEKMEQTEPGLHGAVQTHDLPVTALLDWEVELGVVLLEDRAPGAVPRVGFFVANDLSERALAILGEGRDDRLAYWGASKSHPGFLPTTHTMWVPENPIEDGIPCVDLHTTVNGVEVQRASTTDLVLPLSGLLDATEAAAGAPLRAGTWVLTGTPSGVALATPAWKVALADLVGLDRFARLGAVLPRADDFLAPGDTVVVAADGLGSVETTVVANDAEAPGG